MKLLSFLFLSFLLSFNVLAQLDTNDFVTTWKTYNPGVSGSSSIRILTKQGVGAYNFDIDWDNDGVFDSLGVTSTITHTYPIPGIYTVRIRGLFPAIELGGLPGERKKIVSINQWGNILFTDMNYAFFECENLTYTATDKPNLTPGCDMYGMFYRATLFNGNIGNWDVSNVVNMSFMFAYATTFNNDIGSWDVSSVTDMSNMFSHQSSFNQDLNNWDVSSVTDMTEMFHNATAFAGNISNWDVSSVTSMASLFRNARQFNSNISGWDVSSVTDMLWMFNAAKKFNQNIGTWDVSSVTNMKGVFADAELFNQNIGSWNVTSVTNMSYMFLQTDSFNQDIGQWNLSSVSNSQSMFENSKVFNQDISLWDVSSITFMKDMFKYANKFDQNLGPWNISLVRNMYDIFTVSLVSAANLGMSISNYDSTLIAWQANPHQMNVNIGAWGVRYCLSDSARTLLIADGWNFSGDSKNCTITSIEEEQTKKELSIYPNPTNGIVNIELNEAIENQDVIILNALGQVVKSQIVNGSNKIKIDLSEYPKGLYYVKYNNRLSKLVMGE